ncbi:unnamed protein product, partial [Lampetra planeri]
MAQARNSGGGAEALPQREVADAAAGPEQRRRPEADVNDAGSPRPDTRPAMFLLVVRPRGVRFARRGSQRRESSEFGCERR